MALDLYTRAIDGTIPIQAMLMDDEELWASQDNVGIYNGSRKSAEHQSGTIHVSSHRLFFYSNTSTRKHSFEMTLKNVESTEYYAGLMRSSAKVTLHLGSPSTEEDVIEEPPWECGVCAYKNPSKDKVCGLCGVPKDKSTPTSTSPSTPTLSSTVACPACTFLNASSLLSCEICGTSLPLSVSASTSRSRTPVPDESFIKLSFRSGGDKALYAVLKRALKSKSWQDHRPPPPTLSSTSSYGIGGIMKTVETSARDRDGNISNALQDLETLSIQARSMVALAKDLNARLSSLPYTTSSLSSSTSEPEEAQFIRSSLSQLGLRSAPITDSTWLEGLAQELTSILDNGIMRGRGIIGVDEVWGGWNRARGVSLIPPSTFLQILPLLAPALKIRHMPQSKVQVLYTQRYDEEVFEKRLVDFLKEDEKGKRMWEIAMREGLSVSLITEMVQASSKVLKDDVDGESWWCVNEFVDYEWDGHIFT